MTPQTTAKPRRAPKRRPAITLPEELIAEYADRQPDWGPLGWITYKRTYARMVGGRREEWHETVRRVVEGNINLDPRPRTPEVVAELTAEAEEMFRTVFEMAWLPPGRGLWISGTPYVDRTGDALVNCVSGDTIVHTVDGAVPARTLAGREVPTLSDGGVYRLARWRSYGKQELYRVVFSNGDEIEATAGHEWVVGRGRRVTTLELVGERVPMQPRATFTYDTESYHEGVRHGLIYGDGSLNAVGTRTYLRQFGDSQELIPRFFETHSKPEWASHPAGGVTVTSGHPARWKSLPQGDEGESYIRGFIAGLVAAGGFVNKRGCVGLHQSDRGALERVRELAASVGLPSTSIKRERELNPWTGEPALNYRLTFVRAGFAGDDHMVLKTSHRQKMRAAKPPKKRVSVEVSRVVPTGRVDEVFCCEEPETHTWVAGAGYLTGNCWAVAVRPGIYEGEEHAKPSHPFCMAMDLLMKGGGVGFAVTMDHVSKMPQVRNPVRLAIVCDSHHPNIRELDAEQIPQSTHTLVRVDDTREGWWNALRVVIDAHFKMDRERHLVIDVSDVRAAGEPIRGFGGTAAGPGPLVNLLRAVNGILNDRVGGFLSPVECTDMMNRIGQAVVAGNVRRSAELALGSAEDLAFIGMKLDKEKLYSHRWASNNSIAIDGEFEDFERIADAIAANGEPGIVNLELARTRLRTAHEETDERNEDVIGTNPCFPGSERLLTPTGYVTFGELWADGRRVAVMTDNRVTHDAAGGRRVPENWVIDSAARGYELRGASAVALTRKSAAIVKVTTSDGRTLRCTPDHLIATPDGMVEAGSLVEGGEVLCSSPDIRELSPEEQEAWEIYDATAVVSEISGEPRITSVVSVEPDGTEDVYCLHEPETQSLIVNGFVTSNCGEIALAHGEPCNLAEVFPAVCDRRGIGAERVLELATRYAKRVTFAHYEWPESREVIERNRRVGVSLSGIRDWMVLLGVADPDDLALELDRYYEIVRGADDAYSDELGCARSVSVSTVKPSGTISLLSGSSPGLHAHYAPYYIRRIRFQEQDPLVEIVRQCGFHVEPDAYSPNTVVAEFPVKAVGADDEGFRSAGELTLAEQFATQAALQGHWADNAVSATLTFKPTERRSIPRLLREYRDRLKSTSLLPYAAEGAYAQVPYEPVTKERYEELCTQIIAWPHEVADKLTERRGSEFELVDQDECVGGACPIK